MEKRTNRQNRTFPTKLGPPKGLAAPDPANPVEPGWGGRKGGPPPHTPPRPKTPQQVWTPTRKKKDPKEKKTGGPRPTRGRGPGPGSPAEEENVVVPPNSNKRTTYDDHHKKKKRYATRQNQANPADHTPLICVSPTPRDRIPPPRPAISRWGTPHERERKRRLTSNLPQPHQKPWVPTKQKTQTIGPRSRTNPDPPEPKKRKVPTPGDPKSPPPTQKPKTPTPHSHPQKLRARTGHEMLLMDLPSPQTHPNPTTSPLALTG